MCIAVYKPAGKNLPSKKTFKNCFNNNKDGAGYMYSYNGKVHIEKGLMTFDDFRTSLKDTFRKLGLKDKGKDLPMVFHFRITTQGGVQQELTHPFSMSDSYDDMKKLSNECDIALAHNGIIDFASNYGVKDHNDTMEFIKEVANPMIKGNKNYYKNKTTMDLFNYLLSGNRVVILDGDGHAELIGDWVEDNGVYYSNTTYKATTKSYGSWKSCSSYFGGGWYDEYDSWDNYQKSKSDDGYDDNGFPKPRQMTKSQKYDLHNLKTMFCEVCGSDMYIYYDDEYGCYMAVCIDCGEMYELPTEEAEFALKLGLCDEPYNTSDYQGSAVAVAKN